MAEQTSRPNASEWTELRAFPPPLSPLLALSASLHAVDACVRPEVLKDGERERKVPVPAPAANARARAS